MQVFKPVRALAIVVLGVVLVAGIAITLQRSKHEAERAAVSAFSTRAEFAARVAKSTLAEFPKGHGRQVVASAALPRLARFVHSYLDGAPSVPNADAYLLNARLRVIASGASGRPGRPLADDALASALKARTSGRYGSRRFVSQPVGQTGWRVVFSAPEADIVAPAHAGTSSHPTTLVALLGMLIALVAMALHAVRRTSGLSQAREREAMAVERERAASALAHERLHDGLTGLPNRALFLDRAQHALAALARRNHPVVVMFVDIDRFKRVNDSLGHALGDETIREVARRLHRTVRPMDTVSRLGGDEFVVMCEVEGGETQARGIAARIQSALAEPIKLGQRDLQVTASIGIAIQRPEDRPVDPETLVRDADTAMYSAKQNGGAAIEVFQPELHEIEVERLEMEMALRHAVDRGELRVHYQPIISLADGHARGAEALVRWERPGHGLVSPLEFIPLAESTGMIIPIGQWVLEQGLKDLARWQQTGWIDDDFELTVNLSPRQVADPDLIQSFADILAKTGTRPANLCLEITESMVMDDLDQSVDTLHALKRLGVRLALDDFGVGHSSLGQVARLLPIDILKVDRSFVGGIDQDRDRAVLRNIATLASSLELLAVAEGIETPDQADAVAEMGYPLAQGYLFGAPVPASELRALVEAAGPVAAHAAHAA
jgi:diguanylate cyclase (GGDEF)-like protein